MLHAYFSETNWSEGLQGLQGLFIYLFIYLFVYLFIYLFIYLLIHCTPPVKGARRDKITFFCSSERTSLLLPYSSYISNLVEFLYVLTRNFKKFSCSALFNFPLPCHVTHISLPLLQVYVVTLVGNYQIYWKISSITDSLMIILKMSNILSLVFSWYCI